MASLRRTASGDFRVENARRIGEIVREDRERLLGIDTLFASLPSMTLSGAQEKRCRVGNDFSAEQPEGEYRFYSETGEFLAYGKVKDGSGRAIKSFFEV